MRDGVIKFLTNTFKYWNIFINTKGRKEYAEAILQALDPTNKFHIKENFKAVTDEDFQLKRNKDHK